MAKDQQSLQSNSSWYTKAYQYWDQTEATVDGMLGGLSKVHQPDIEGSKALIREIQTRYPGALQRTSDGNNLIACEIGAGIGRITKALLVNICDKVDVVEPTLSFVQKLATNLNECPQLGSIFQVPANDFQFPLDKYSLVWAQWVLQHLTDDDLVKFLHDACKAVKAQNGVVVVKENFLRSITTSDEQHFDITDFNDVKRCDHTAFDSSHYAYDAEDSSVTRSERLWCSLISKAGCKILFAVKQTGFPDNLFPVRMMVLQLKD
ncbi:hypothetical protein MP228_006308 [Amoeboaphelidium protococcarum]|nr:hypothetical protein MP228_006308 [Amoeboaphelidium protococcarum]